MGIEVALLAAATGISAYSSIQQGAAQEAMYDVQAMQATAESERKALEYELRANDTLRDLQKRNAANIARAYGGGVDGLSGSSKLMEKVNNKQAGRDLMFDVVNTKNALLQGTTQSEIYQTSGKIAKQSGILDAAAKLGMAGYEYKKTGKE